MNASVQVPDSYADLTACDADGNHFTIQGYPNLCDVATRMAMDNGCINRAETTADFYSLCDPILASVDVAEILALDTWIGSLTNDERDTLADGEESDRETLVAGCPLGGPDMMPLAKLLDDIFEVM